MGTSVPKTTPSEAENRETRTLKAVCARCGGTGRLPHTVATPWCWCITCKRRQLGDPAECFRSGWPKCCGQTMTIDSPQRRAALKRAHLQHGAAPRE